MSPAGPASGSEGGWPGRGDVDLLGFVVAHQGWYGVVGSDAHREPWLDEGLANGSAVWWIEGAHGREAAETAWDLLVLLPYRLQRMDRDLPLNLPAEDYDDLAYAGVVYGRGA